MIGIIGAATVAVALTVPAHAQVDCADWNTAAFFNTAEAADATRCLQAGADPNAQIEDGVTPLQLAAILGRAETVTRLLEARYTLSAGAPKYFLVVNEAERTRLGHHPAYMIHQGSVDYGPFDYAAEALCRRRVPAAERRLGHAGRVGRGGSAVAGYGRGEVAHRRVPPPPAG